ncbi:MAG: ABC transporter ATP-binding protein [Actinomycetota bacterium]|nr:ABC transporter ATP-binding protein [Actinomycetota bacterium]
MSLLSVRDLVVRFGTEAEPVYAVNGVDFELDEGDTLGLVGESGSGKTVTSLAIIGLLPRTGARIERGEIVFNDVDLTSLAESALRRYRGKEIAMVFQDPMTSLNPVLTIEEQVVETIAAHQRIRSKAARERALELLELVGIPRPQEQLRRYPHQFSGGMRQRVMIAIAIALQPKLLIADEPTTALDVTVQAQILELMQDLTAESGTAVILISHDLGVVARTTQRVAVMYAGFVVESAHTPELFAHPRHPYTVGLLHSIPRLDTEPDDELTPIEGAPPDQTHEPVGCPFAPRCRWRLEACWSEMPPLVAVAAAHLLACHNPATDEEALAGHPLRPGFAAAAEPSALVERV